MTEKLPQYPAPTKGDRKIPEPALRAREALEILRAEDAVKADSLTKILPAFAMKLAQYGDVATVDILLARARAGELDLKTAPEQKQRSYAEIVARISGPPLPQTDNEALLSAAENGDLDKLKRLVVQGADVHTKTDMAVSYAIENDNLEILKYLVEEKGINIHAVEERALKLALGYGRVEIAKYLIEEKGAVLNAQNYVRIYIMEAEKGYLEIIKYLEKKNLPLPRFSMADMAGTGQLEILKYLVEERGMDIHAENESALRSATHNDQMEAAKYLLKKGADVNALDPPENKTLKDYLKNRLVWQRVVHCLPPLHLHEGDSSFFRPKAFDAILRFLWQQENYILSKEVCQMAFHASSLFGTENRVLQYLEQWGKSGKQPLHDLIYQIKLPGVKTPEMNLAAWADAVLKCGPTMAKLVKFADRVPVPEKSADGKTWSIVKTKEKIAQFIYPNGKENPELAALCMEHTVDEEDFNSALTLSKQIPKTKNIPDIIIDGKEFDKEGAKFYRLPVNDLRGLFLGEFTDCCQSVGGNGTACAEHGFTSENAGFYVVENAQGKIVAETWAWRGERGELVFDSLETLGQNVTDDQWKKLTKAFAKALTEKPGNVTALHIGTGGKTPKSLSQAFNATAKPSTPIGYNGYRDSHNQMTVWKKSTVQP